MYDDYIMPVTGTVLVHVKISISLVMYACVCTVQDSSMAFRKTFHQRID